VVAVAAEGELDEVDWWLAGVTAAGPAFEDRLERSDRSREGQAGRGGKGFNRSSVRNPCTAVTRPVW
jgi:hypothetical protein